MKRTFFYFLFCLPFLAMLGGCLKQSDQESKPLPTITGSYAGQFARLRWNAANKKYDTLKTTLTVNLNISTGFTISGDTTTHAGSFGDYSYDGFYFQFVDKTMPKTGYPAKPHLSGLYLYGFDGTNLQLQQTYPLDTLGYFYSLKKL